MYIDTERKRERERERLVKNVVTNTIHYPNRTHTVHHYIILHSSFLIINLFTFSPQ